MINNRKESIVLLFVVMLFLSATAKAQLKLQPLIGFGMQSMRYDFGNTDIKGSTGLNIGADLFYYLNENMAVGAGIRFATYKTTATLSSYESTSEGTDVDGDTYEGTTTLSGINEKHTQAAIEIPLLGRYQKWVSSDIIVFGTTGPVFVIPGSSKSEIKSGTLSTSGYYEEWNLTVDDASGYDYGTDDLSGTSVKQSAKMSLAWDLECGAEYYLNKRINLSVTAFYQPGLTNFIGGSNDSSNSFDGTLSGAGSAKLTKLGIRFGLTIDLTPPERASVKSIR